MFKEAKSSIFGINDNSIKMCTYKHTGTHIEHAHVQFSYILCMCTSLISINM